MLRKSKLAAATLLAAGTATGLVFTGPAAHALTGTPEPTSWGKANMISYADSDFESGVGNWAPVSNSTMSQDTTTAQHGQDSLRVAATAAGSAVFKMGSATSTTQVNFTGGDTYRLSGWFKSAQTGRTIAFALGLYDSTGTWIGWSSGTAVTLNSAGKYQYVSETITTPANAAWAISSPRITETGMNAGEALNVDEVLVEPYRAATLIGAKDPSTDGSAWSTMNSTVGPSQVDKMFYSGSLPSTYASSNCGSLQSSHPNVTCVQAYKTPDTNVAAYVASIPADRNVILVFHQEPEGDTFANGPDGCNAGTDSGNFVCEDKAQANLVHGAVTASNRANVWFSDDSSGYNYGTGRTGDGCAWTVPSSYVDIYLMDHYMNPVDGSNSQVYGTAGQHSEFTNWIGCVGPQNKPVGFGEYGTNCKTGMNPDDNLVEQTFAADAALLQGESFQGTAGGVNTATYTRPFVNWMYWWYNNTDNCQFQPGASPDGTGVTNQWIANETANGGGAN